MTEQGSKPFWKSRTFWGGVIAAFGGICGQVAEMLTTGEISAASITAVLGGVLAIIGRFKAARPIG